MNQDGIDKSRRRFLTTAATVVGGIGAVATAVPFISTMMPSARARASGAPVEVDIGDLKPGELRVVKWQGKPVWFLRRAEDEVAALPELDAELRDPASEEPQQPAYAVNEHRSVKPELLIVVGLCTHLGCSPTHVRVGDAQSHGLPTDWKGGFFCPCHGSRFDLAGRVFKDVPAPRNLLVPPHQYLSETRILIGNDPGVTS
ncbi:MAG: ubiquinol-cytochrome c reductase iron-sulfur subunit [Gammaproteobacteria bacterium]|nr:ubiquinol-cytochrome c reductase iron-sulfur subunit [Gammaproteobacteria bacterium]